MACWLHPYGCSVHHKKGTFLGVTSTAQITPSPIHVGREHCSDHCWEHLTLFPWQSWGGAVWDNPKGTDACWTGAFCLKVDKSPSGGTGMGGGSYVFLYPMRPWEISKDESFSTIRNTNPLWLVICGHHPLSIPRSLCFLFKANGCATCSSQQSWTPFDFLTLVPASYRCSLSPASLLPSIVSS